MARVKINLSEDGQGVEIELESPDEMIDALITKAVMMTGSLGEWLDKKTVIN